MPNGSSTAVELEPIRSYENAVLPAQLSPLEASQELIANRRLRFRFMRHDTWENALFVHFPIDPDILRRELPRGLEPDILEGSAWIGVVLLTETGVSVTPAAGRRCAPKIDHIGANIRTYVRCNGNPGIFFFSLECSSVMASAGARVAGIPYYPAKMSRSVDRERPLAKRAEKGMPKNDPTFVFTFASQRGTCRKGPSVSARWSLQGEVGDLEEHDMARAQWFVERYSVFVAWPWGRGPFLLRGDVEHPAWPLQPASLHSFNASELLIAAGFAELADAARIEESKERSSVCSPHVCFSRGVGPVDFWMLEPV